MDNKDGLGNLKNCGLKNTKQRKAILDILENQTSPMGAEQIFCELMKKGISVNMSTIYRTLEILSEKKLVLKINLSEMNNAVYEYNRMVHRHYLTCLKCKKIIAINCCPIKSYEKNLEKETNYVITGHKLDIYGICPECLKSQKI